MKTPSKIIIAVLGCLVLGGVFGLGYWQGQRALRAEMTAGLASSSARLNTVHPMPAPVIPGNASPELKEFLQNQVALSQKMEQLRGPGSNTPLTPQVFAQFRQENADLLKRQSELSQIIAQQQNKNVPATPLQIPPNASPQLQAYLKARDQLMRDQVAFM